MGGVAIAVETLATGLDSDAVRVLAKRVEDAIVIEHGGNVSREDAKAQRDYASFVTPAKPGGSLFFYHVGVEKLDPRLRVNDEMDVRESSRLRAFAASRDELILRFQRRLESRRVARKR